MKVRIDTNGDVRAVYSDNLLNFDLGPMEVTRVSNVEFNTATQEWEAHTSKGEQIAHGPSRDEVIKQEIEVIEARL